MGYDTPKREVYLFPSSAFGATTESRKILGPKGKKGLVRDIRTYLTADCIGTTSVPEINVGSAASTAGGTLYTEYARHRLGTTATAGNTAANTPYRARALAEGGANNPGGTPLVLSDFAGHVQLETAFIPADTAFFITRVQGVGGVPAGTGTTEVEIDWF
ncbi:hypothetical protein I6F35_33715 [Bradyrhizobium sp. BRP22]|uniref:hypothetical protein n=1 Tax=Bradyrhizobium sp. BRP22 TaxID=2793821 RepID=UPI001CD77657|nr:hypothetical protein [Bradyrhizobium sp. BRP22]MCA1458094.1 hypothetical protein [Bradyrhizobium sp. BRP22]